ncbi:MAG TPA: YciI family protein [Planctomycetota bacterium]|nr:YciI family protein [Planctomycetota bacterium]
MRVHLPFLLLGSVPAWLAGCQGGADPADGAGPVEPVAVAPPAAAPAAAPAAVPAVDTDAAERHCTLVLLKTGPRREPLSDSERSQIFGGHFGNMQRLAREGHLLVAGPYGKEKSDAALRGLFVLDTVDPERARQLAETDPGFKAGVFTFDYHMMATAAPLRAFLAAELAAQDDAARGGRTQAPGDRLRSYVLLTADDGAAAAAALAGVPAVLWFARLDSTRAFVLLDAPDVEAARALLAPVVRALGAHHLDQWSASSGLVDLPKLARS